jgi:hypothetical protein
MRAAASLVVLLGLSLAACDNAYTTSDKETCELLAQADCTRLDQCIFHGVVDRFGDEDTCEKIYTARCKAQFEANHTGEHSSETEACVAALAPASCADVEDDTVDACQSSPGTAGIGAACAFSTQCGTAFCALDTNGNCGTCQQLSNAGDDCSAHGCSPGFECVPSTMTCQPRSAPDGSCSASEPCAFALSCVTPAGASTGTCVAARQVAGYPCDATLENGPGCDVNSGLTCDPSTNTCIALTYATAGQPCGLVSGTTVACEKKSSCHGASATTAGTCVAFAAPGAKCDTVAGPDCEPLAVCVTGSATVTAGTCKQLDASSCH